MTVVSASSQSESFRDLNAEDQCVNIGRFMIGAGRYIHFGAACGFITGCLRPIALSSAVIFGAIQGLAYYLVEPANQQFFKLLEFNPIIMKKVVPILATNGLAIGIANLIGISITFTSALLFYAVAMAVFYVMKGFSELVEAVRANL